MLAEKKGMTLKELGNQKGSEENIDSIEQQKTNYLAESVIQRAEAIEPVITNIMKKLETRHWNIITNKEYRKRLENSNVNGDFILIDDFIDKVNSGEITSYTTLVGLNRRLKEKGSLSRKIIMASKTKSLERNVKVTFEQVSYDIGDSLRYTLLIDKEHYKEKVISSLTEL